MSLKNLLNKIEIIYETFKTGVLNLIIWFKVIWKDRDYDFYYIFEILKHKLKKQAKYQSDKNKEYKKSDIDKMNLTINLIEKVQSDYYSDEYTDYYENVHNWLEIPDKEGYVQLNVEQISENFDEYFKKYPLQYKKCIENKINRFNTVNKTKEIIAMEIAYENEKRARKLLFKLMEENIQRWWD